MFSVEVQRWQQAVRRNDKLQSNRPELAKNRPKILFIL